MSPDLIRHVRDSGLLCISWGGLNDVPEHAKIIRPLCEFELTRDKKFSRYMILKMFNTSIDASEGWP